jgi:hypothetical protein
MTYRNVCNFTKTYCQERDIMKLNFWIKKHLHKKISNFYQIYQILLQVQILRRGR